MLSAILKKPVSAAAFAFTVLAGAAVAGIYVFNIVQWADYPDFGYGFRTATGINVAGMVTPNGAKSGLQVGDRFVEINGQRFSDLAQFRALMRRALGAENVYRIERGGSRIDVTIRNAPIGFKRAFYKSGLLFLLGLGYALIGILVFLMKPHARSSWIFFLFTAVMGMFISFLYKISTMTPAWLETVHIFIYTFMPATLAHLTLAFPQERLVLKRRPWTQLVPYLLSLALFACARVLTPNIMDAPRAVMIAVMAWVALSVVLFLASCLQLRMTTTSDIVRLRARMILLGFAIAASVPLLDFVSSVLFGVYLLPDFNLYLPFFIVFPAFVGYSIVKHNLFDIDAIIKRTYGYVLFTGALAGFYGIFVFVSNRAFGEYEFARAEAFPLPFIISVVIVFNPLRLRVQRLIDRVFYRLDYDYRETVQQVSRRMRTLLDRDEIGRAVMDTALGTMFIDSGCVVLRNRNNVKYECLIPAGQRDSAAAPVNHHLEEGHRANGAGTAGADAQEIEEASYTIRPAGAVSHLKGLTIGDDEPLIRRLAEQQKALTVYDVEEDPAFEDTREACRKVFGRIEATLLVPMIYERRLAGLIALGRKKSGKFYRREDILLLDTLANQASVAIENAYKIEEIIEKERLKTRIMDAFGKYVTREVRDQILEGRIPLDGEIKEVTVLFADLRDFTTLAESNPPRDVVKILNEYFSEMAKAIRRHHGLVLQFIGDEIEAVFGAPLALENHPAHAVAAAIEMRERLVGVNAKLRQQGYRPLRHGIGLHTGKVLAANIGSDDRLSYAMVGDTVNIASRVQGLNKTYSTEILMTATTRAGLHNGNIPIEKLPVTAVKGRRDPVEIYKLT
jgi:class 3 adenylate cyclase